MYGFSLASINITAILIVVILKWYLAKGILKPVYYLGIVASCLFTCINVMMFLHDPAQWSIMLLNLLNAYAIVMNIIGLRRLARETNEQARQA